MKKTILTLIFLMNGLSTAWAGTSISVNDLNKLLIKNNSTFGNCRDLKVEVLEDSVHLVFTSERNGFQVGQVLAMPATDRIPVQITNLPNGARELKIESIHEDLGRREGATSAQKIKRQDIMYITIGSDDSLKSIDWEAYEKYSFFERWQSLGGRRPFCD